MRPLIFFRKSKIANVGLIILFIVVFKSNVFGMQSNSVEVNQYYVDELSGSDNNTGLTEKEAWKTLLKVNTTQFEAGDIISFRRNGKWNGQLYPKGSGVKGNPIRVGAYGKGNKPLIAGNGVADGTIRLYNQQYWEISDLEITNYNGSEENGINLLNWEKQNKLSYAVPILPQQFANKNAPKYGIYILGEDVGAINHIYLKNLNIHGVNGYIDQEDEKSKENGGIYFKIIGRSKPTYFNEILIDFCTIHDVDRTGILLCHSTWDQRSLTKNINWTPSTNIVIKNNKFGHTGANALIVRVSKKPLIERNLFDHCAVKASGNAGFSFNCDDAVWQYNESRFTKANINDRDAGGIDSDYMAKNTIIQYNYIHDNDFGMLVTGGPGRFNDSTIVRYNIFENDGKLAHPTHGKCVIRLGGSATNTHIHNNIIYLGEDQNNTKVVSHEVWKTSPNNTLYQNNIFYNLSKNAYCDLEESSNNIFDHNLFFGSPIDGMPNDIHSIKGNPKFLSGKKGAMKYQLGKNSPALNSGAIIKDNALKDFYGNSVQESKNSNIGIDERR